MDYFTKWAEAKALANIWDMDVKKFVWRNIVTRFGMPDSLVSDNGLQFDNRAFREFWSDLGIKNKYSTPTYPQSNRLKKRLEGMKGKWAKELPNVLWAYRITPRRSMGETPFSLTYGVEAIIPAKSARVTRFALTQNGELMAKHLDLLEKC